MMLSRIGNKRIFAFLSSSTITGAAPQKAISARAASSLSSHCRGTSEPWP